MGTLGSWLCAATPAEAVLSTSLLGRNEGLGDRRLSSAVRQAEKHAASEHTLPRSIRYLGADGRPATGVDQVILAQPRQHPRLHGARDSQRPRATWGSGSLSMRASHFTTSWHPCSSHAEVVRLSHSARQKSLRTTCNSCMGRCSHVYYDGTSFKGTRPTCEGSSAASRGRNT